VTQDVYTFAIYPVIYYKFQKWLAVFKTAALNRSATHPGGIRRPRLAAGEASRGSAHPQALTPNRRS
jgi:hypothetical protein